MDIEKLFDKHEDDFLGFAKINNKRSNRPDLHAFLLLDELFPGNTDMIGGAEHDEFWLDIEIEDIEKLTEEQVIELVRCGVRFDEESLCMFT